VDWAAWVARSLWPRQLNGSVFLGDEVDPHASRGACATVIAIVWLQTLDEALDFCEDARGTEGAVSVGQSATARSCFPKSRGGVKVAGHGSTSAHDPLKG